MDFSVIKKTLAGEPAFRYKQVWRAVFVDLIEDWSQASTLSKALRERLTAEAPIAIEAKVQKSHDGKTQKAAICFVSTNKSAEGENTEMHPSFASPDYRGGIRHPVPGGTTLPVRSTGHPSAGGDIVETVLMRHEDERNTVCVSSQVGCALGCTFCLTGQGGFRRNLTADEIVAQVLFFARRLRRGELRSPNPAQTEGARVTNVVFMGMGEPLLNYEAVLAAVKILNDPDGLNIGARKISISTVGVVPGIRKLAGEALQVNLAVSLHAPDDGLRRSFMPIAERYSLKALLRAVREYQERTNRQVMIEYVLLKDINDSTEQARALAALLIDTLTPIFTVNLIAYNATDRFEPSPNTARAAFKSELQKAHINVIERYRFGRDIKAACGQLSGKSQ